MISDRFRLFLFIWGIIQIQSLILLLIWFKFLLSDYIILVENHRQVFVNNFLIILIYLDIGGYIFREEFILLILDFV